MTNNSFQIINEIQTIKVMEGKKIDLACAHLEEKLSVQKGEHNFRTMMDELSGKVNMVTQSLAQNRKEIERLDTHFGNLRTLQTNSSTEAQDSSKRVLQTEREWQSQIQKVQNDLRELNCHAKDQEGLNTHFKALIDQISKSIDLKIHTTLGTAQDGQTNLGYKYESLEKSVQKLKREQESQIQSMKDLVKSNWTQLNQKLELQQESLKAGSSTELFQRRLTSIEDLFETQRKELFSSMAELERASSKKLDNLAKAIKEICSEVKIQNPLLLMS